MVNTACSTQKLAKSNMASISAVSSIGRTRFDGRASSGGRTRMMMMIDPFVVNTSKLAPTVAVGRDDILC